MQKKIKELKLEMPPTRQTVQKLFEALNLYLPAVRAIECILHCRGLKLEKSDPSEFQIEKLYEWFHLNIRTLQHISLENVDPNWVEENQHIVESSKEQIPLPPLKYAPNYYLRKGEGNYASRNNKIILLQKLQNDQILTCPKAFEEYGMYANQMAEAFDRNDKKNANKDYNSIRTSFEKKPMRLNSLQSSLHLTQHRQFKQAQD